MGTCSKFGSVCVSVAACKCEQHFSPSGRNCICVRGALWDFRVFFFGVHGGSAEGAWFHCRQQSELAVSAALHRSMKENVIPPNPCCSAGALLPWGWTKSYVLPRRGGLCAATGLCAAGAVPCPVTPVAALSRNARRSQCQSCYRVVRQVWRPWRKHRRRPARRR